MSAQADHQVAMLSAVVCQEANDDGALDTVLYAPIMLHCVTTGSKVCCTLVTAQHDRLMQGHTSMFCSIGAVGTIASKKRCSCACCRYPRLPSSNTESCNRCRHDKSAHEGVHTTSGQQRVMKEPGLKSVPRLRPVRGTLRAIVLRPRTCWLEQSLQYADSCAAQVPNTLLSVFVSANPLLTSLNAEVCKLM